MEPSNDWSLSTLLYNYKISWERAESLYNMAFKDNVQIPLVTKDQILEVLEMAQEKKNLINTQMRYPNRVLKCNSIQYKELCWEKVEGRKKKQELQRNTWAVMYKNELI